MFYDMVSEFKSVLWIASLSVHSRKKWMMIPNKSYHIASRYSVTSVSFFMNLNIAFFSLVIALCIASSKHKIITNGFIDNIHWIQVKLKHNCPLPSVIDRWRQNYNEGARA